MKNTLLLILLSFLLVDMTAQHNNSEIPNSINSDGSAPDASAILDIQSTNKGVLIPRMTTAQRTNISNAAEGLLVFDSQTGSFWFYHSATWTELGGNQGNVAWGDITSVPADLADGDDVLSETQVDVMVANNGYLQNEADGDPTNEIELPTGGANGQILQTDGSGTVSWTDDLTEDNDWSVAGNSVVRSTGDNHTSSGGGYAKVGDPSGQHISMDINDIQARNGASNSTLYLNYWGGHINLLHPTNGNGNLQVGGNTGLFYNNSNKKFGVGNLSPTAKLDISGKIKIADDADTPVAGMIRWNDEQRKFEGWNGVFWASFTVLETGTLTDIDGNTYLTGKIGNYQWMLENLKVSRYKNGTVIPNHQDSTIWFDQWETGAWCNYNNDAGLDHAYGKLYNARAVISGNLCPSGWRRPSNTEWVDLINSLGGQNGAGGKMKATGTTNDGSGLWEAPNSGANNSSGFSAVPSGYRVKGVSQFQGIEKKTYWYEASACTQLANQPNSCTAYQLTSTSADLQDFGLSQDSGFPVRCVKND